MISWQLASLTFIISQSGSLKLLLFQLGYQKFFDPETPEVWRPKNLGFRGWNMSGVPGPRGFGEPRGGNPISDSDFDELVGLNLVYLKILKLLKSAHFLLYDFVCFILIQAFDSFVSRTNFIYCNVHDYELDMPE